MRNTDSTTPLRQVRAVFDSSSIRVYQAYNDQIADVALANQKFAPPFSMARMTWIKPSFLWMMYRSGWSRKDIGQKRILAIDIKRSGFEWALKNACLTDGANMDRRKPVRVQWDPERNINLGRLEYKSIQIGLTKVAVTKYVSDWILKISDVTALAKLVERTRDPTDLPEELPYPVPEDIAALLQMT
jgi:hypothetical protein